jgi:hypothetical protein
MVLKLRWIAITHVPKMLPERDWYHSWTGYNDLRLTVFTSDELYQLELDDNECQFDCTNLRWTGPAPLGMYKSELDNTKHQMDYCISTSDELYQPQMDCIRWFENFNLYGMYPTSDGHHNPDLNTMHHQTGPPWVGQYTTPDILHQLQAN